jgi:hypothetical protein
MGNFFSQQLGQIIQEMQAPKQRSPVREGGSGLNYSGQVYANQFNKLSSETCGDVTVKYEQVDDAYPGPLISSDGLPFDETTKRIDPNALSEHIKRKKSDGVIPRNDITNYNDQMKADLAFYATAQAEYCFFEVRYKAALYKFLDMVSQQTGPDAGSNDVLAKTVKLNRRLNSLLEVMNSVANERAENVNKRNPNIDTANDELQKKIKQLQDQQVALSASNARTKTQEEMIRYSAEKSHAMNIQIAFFVGLNVVALGTIITVYKNTRPGGV